MSRAAQSRTTVPACAPPPAAARRRLLPKRTLMFGIPIGELAILAAAVAGGGVLTGLMAGMFGIGGGAVIVPVLYEVFGVLGVPEEVHMQLCIGTSLAIIVPTNLRSYLA